MSSFGLIEKNMELSHIYLAVNLVKMFGKDMDVPKSFKIEKDVTVILQVTVP